MITRGIATFGLDTGTCPRWLFERMVKLPDKPTVTLNNWLMDLTNDNDPKRSSVFLIGVSPIVNNLWNEIVKHNPRGLIQQYEIGKKIAIERKISDLEKEK